MRKNKRSQLSYKARIDLCMKYVEKYKKMFENQFKKVTLIVSTPLRPEEYQKYMESRGFYLKNE